MGTSDRSRGPWLSLALTFQGPHPRGPQSPLQAGPHQVLPGAPSGVALQTQGPFSESEPTGTDRPAVSRGHARRLLKRTVGGEPEAKGPGHSPGLTPTAPRPANDLPGNTSPQILEAGSRCPQRRPGRCPLGTAPSRSQAEPVRGGSPGRTQDCARLPLSSPSPTPVFGVLGAMGSLRAAPLGAGPLRTVSARSGLPCPSHGWDGHRR